MRGSEGSDVPEGFAATPLGGNGQKESFSDCIDGVDNERRRLV